MRRRNMLRTMTSCMLAGAMLTTSATQTFAEQTTITATEDATEATAAEEATEAATAEEQVTEESGTADTELYNSLFSMDRVHEINIEISDEDWADLLANPTDKTKYKVNVTIDGNEMNDVSFATKGNTSLSSVASSDSDRYSFKINFGKYVDDQTYFGLDKLNLNNLYADATYMKDYLSYRIFQEAGAYSTQCSYIWVTVNGEDYGLYLALEDVGDTWLEENTDGEGELYKPETDQLDNVGAAGGPGANGPDGDFDPSKFMNNEGNEAGTPPEMPESMSEGTDQNAATSEDGMQPSAGTPGEMPAPGENGGPGGMGSSNNGASLKYTDDEIDSYSDIFDNAETDVTEEDEERVIAALKGISEAEGSDLENYLDTDEVIRYFVAHNFTMNYDSYTGSMLHNYYLYENDGKLSMIPWDYNLAFGTFMGQGGDMKNFEQPASENESAEAENTDAASADETINTAADATSIVNYGIDTPLSGTTEDDRPMWSWITSNEEYLEAYHQAYDELLTNYFESGKFEEEITSVYELIEPYIENDPTAFYTVDEFKTAYETLKSFCSLRAESIRKQLSGELSTSTDEQVSSAQVDASDLSISDMGTQGGQQGMPGQGDQQGMPGQGNQQGMPGQGDQQGQNAPMGFPGQDDTEQNGTEQNN